MTLIVTKKNGPQGLILVVTDQDLLGGKFSEGKLQLDLTKEFYQGEEKTKEEIFKLFTEARDLHLTGKEAVALGIEKNLVDSDKILYIEKVPHAEVALQG
jgi:uncharacterized protein